MTVGDSDILLPVIVAMALETPQISKKLLSQSSTNALAVLSDVCEVL
jgi:hypothetical protein